MPSPFRRGLAEGLVANLYQFFLFIRLRPFAESNEENKGLISLCTETLIRNPSPRGRGEQRVTVESGSTSVCPL